MVQRGMRHLKGLELGPQCLPSLGALRVHCSLPGKPAASTWTPLATWRGESPRGQDSILRDGGSKARADSCTSQTLFLEMNSLLPPTWSSFLESCPSVYVLKASLRVCSVEPGTEARRKHGLQMDREEGCKDSGQNLVSFQPAQSQNRGPQPVGPRKKGLLAQHLLTSCGAAGRVTRLCWVSDLVAIVWAPRGCSQGSHFLQLLL